MKKTVFFLLLYLFFAISKTFATAQVPDYLIYKDDTLAIFANPLEAREDIDSLRSEILYEFSTACWRGYVAQWSIIDDQLYLVGFLPEGIRDLKEIFGNEFVEGKVKADWFSGKIISPQGKELYYVHMGYESLYERELEFKFDKGKLLDIKEHDNSTSKQSSYKDKKLIDFIYNHINWHDLSLSNEPIRVALKFSGNENGIIDSVEVIRGYNEVFNNEAIRVIKLIPEWDIYYRRKEFKRSFYFISIVFSEEKKEKYQIR
jgi:hypothetical protein